MSQYKLDYSNVDIASDEVVRFLKKEKIDKTEITKLRLGMEENLLSFLDNGFEGADFWVDLSAGVWGVKIKLMVFGREKNPFDYSTGETDIATAIMKNALSDIGAMPVWKYIGGCNNIIYSVKKKTSTSVIPMVIAIFFGLLLGNTLRYLPQNIVDIFTGYIVTPVTNIFTGLLNTMAGPLILLGVIWGIVNIGEVNEFSFFGRFMFFRFMIFLILGGTVGMLCSLVVFNLPVRWGGRTFNQFLIDFLELFVPKDMFTPFIYGNTLQIVTMGIFTGVVVRLVNDRIPVLKEITNQLNIIVNMGMGIFEKLIPLFSFVSVYVIARDASPEDYMALLKLVILFLVFAVVLIDAVALVVCLRLSMSPLLLLDKVKPVISDIFTSNSIQDIYTKNLSVCVERLGVDHKLADFAIPFSQVVYKPYLAFMFIGFGVFFTKTYGLMVGPETVIAIFLMAVILSIVSSPVKGGAVAAFAVIFIQLGIPAEGLGLVMALNVLFDIVAAYVNSLGGQCIVLMAAGRTNMLNKDILYKKED